MRVIEQTLRCHSVNRIEEFLPVRHNTPAVRISVRFLFVMILMTSFMVTASSTNANSLGDWFKKVGDAFAHPHKKPSPTPHHASRGKPGETVSPSPTPPPAASPEPTVRTASVVNEGRNLRRDLPYAIPVAGKPGFVTSPYSPTQGMVDVRGIPSGTEVKDPYSGKSFLTP